MRYFNYFTLSMKILKISTHPAYHRVWKEKKNMLEDFIISMYMQCFNQESLL